MGSYKIAAMLRVGVKQSQMGLYGLNFFTAAVQAGFGPFVAVWLTLNGWHLQALGIALTVGTVAALVGQVPGGVLVDQIHRNRVTAGGALLVLGFSALMLSEVPTREVVWGAEIAHGLASCVMTPAIAALTLSVCGHDAFSERLGQNTRYASLGNAAGAALLGLAASTVSEQAVFQATALFVVPAVLTLVLIRSRFESRDDHHAMRHPRDREHRSWKIFHDPALHVFAVSLVLFQVANAALLPVALSGLTHRGGAPGWLVSLTIVVPQIVAAAIAPKAGALAQVMGRRPILLAGFATVPLRAVLIALWPDALPLVAVQALDGVSAAVFGVMLPLIAADLTKRTGYLNLAIGALGLASGIGGALSTTAAGWIGDHVGAGATYLFLAATGSLAVILLWFQMPETHPARLHAKPVKR